MSLLTVVNVLQIFSCCGSILCMVGIPGVLSEGFSGFLPLIAIGILFFTVAPHYDIWLSSPPCTRIECWGKTFSIVNTADARIIPPGRAFHYVADLHCLFILIKSHSWRSLLPLPPLLWFLTLFFESPALYQFRDKSVGSFRIYIEFFFYFVFQ